MREAYLCHLRQIVDRVRADGFYKTERVIESPQAPEIRVNGTAGVLNFCANNYLGLADDPRLVKAAQEALGQWGFGMASVRFICGTQTVHKQLEAALSEFLRVDDSILYSSCFDANGGLFETLLKKKTRSSAMNEPRQHRRRHPALQGEAFSLPQQRYRFDLEPDCRRPTQRSAVQADLATDRVFGRSLPICARFARSRTGTARW
jgi:hypothetical protein